MSATPVDGREVSIGGIVVSYGRARAALDCLVSSPGLMVRQPLAAIRNPLAACDYHAAAAPWKDFFVAVSASAGRGAAGRHITKQAFCTALEFALAAARLAGPREAFAHEIAAAYEAFGSDFSYAAAMASAAVSIREREHAARLRARIGHAVHQAVSACEARRGEFQCTVASACGTGGCRFAAELAGHPYHADAGEDRGARAFRRPDNHAQAGQRFGIAPALTVLAAAEPYRVAVPVHDGDLACARDSAPAQSVAAVCG